MKTFLLLLVMLLTTGGASAQSVPAAQVPAAAAATFRRAFPDAKKAKWEKEGFDYEVRFSEFKVGTTALITAAGLLRETTEGIYPILLPESIRKAIAANYSDYKILAAAKVVAATGIITYEAEVRRGGKHHVVLLFDADGRALRRAPDHDVQGSD